ncbi:MAG: hypothetical protein NVSMB18_28550 [Acetobacteraceae bacterium]
MGTITTFADGEPIFREGDTPQFMYVVLSGVLRIGRSGRPDEDAGPGTLLGILSLLDQRNWAVSATARGDCELALFDRKKFRFMIEEVPSFSSYVTLKLASRLRRTDGSERVPTEDVGAAV